MERYEVIVKRGENEVLVKLCIFAEIVSRGRIRILEESFFAEIAHEFLPIRMLIEAVLDLAEEVDEW